MDKQVIYDSWRIRLYQQGQTLEKSSNYLKLLNSPPLYFPGNDINNIINKDYDLHS